MLIYQHCHLDFPELAAELDAVLGRARAAGIAAMLSISTRVKRLANLFTIAEAHANVFCSVGTFVLLKLIGLVAMLLAIRAGWAGRLRDRTSLYRVVRAVGRWSMIDVFMESILVALVQFGAVVTIDPGFGAVAFAAVVILTMFAAEGFDPRLMWDAAAPRAASPQEERASA